MVFRIMALNSLSKLKMLKADEWDLYDNDRSDFNLRVMLPRSYKAAEPFANLPPLSSLGGFGGAGALGAFADPDVQAGFQAFAKAHKIDTEWRKVITAIDNYGLSKGLPNFVSFAFMGGGAPLDMIGVGLRGTRGTVMDMYKQPERLVDYMERSVEQTVSMISKMPLIPGSSPVAFMALHRGADGFMSEAQFNKFYWPYLKRNVEAYIDAGIVPLLFAEGGYNSRLEIVQELPAKSVIWHLDQTDIFRANEILGDKACIMGNIPTSLLVTGSVDEVKSHCKKLIDVIGKDGGYILAPGATADEAKIENLRAMYESAKEYGRY